MWQGGDLQEASAELLHLWEDPEGMRVYAASIKFSYLDSSWG